MPLIHGSLPIGAGWTLTFSAAVVRADDATGRRPAAAGTAPGLVDILHADIGELRRGFSQPGAQSSLAYRVVTTLLDERRGHARYRTKILYCPPLGLLRRSRPSDGSSARFLHDFWRREVWRERGVLARLRLLAALPLWPVVTLGTLAWFTWLNGRAVVRRTGKSRVRQMLEELQLAAAHDVLPPWYYMYELYDEAARRRAGEYLHRFETKGGLFRFVRRRRYSDHSTPLADKLGFAAWCRERGLRTVPVLLAAAKGELLPGLAPEAGSEPQLPEIDLFVKPTSGRGGSGAERWRFQGGGRWADGRGRVLTHAQLLEHVRQRSLERGCMVQPRLSNHPELAELSNGVLSTLRVVTVENERGGYEPTHAVLRMAVGAHSVVDNFHAGGIAAKVDLRTGELGRATDIGLRPEIGWCETHPDTHAKILGRRLPFWDETLALASRAHATFADRVVIGWDIALLEDGPVLIEGNGGPDVDILQRCHREPLGGSRFAELLAFHVRRELAARAGCAAAGRTPGAKP